MADKSSYPDTNKPVRLHYSLATEGLGDEGKAADKKPAKREPRKPDDDAKMKRGVGY